MGLTQREKRIKSKANRLTLQQAKALVADWREYFKGKDGWKKVCASLETLEVLGLITESMENMMIHNIVYLDAPAFEYRCKWFLSFYERKDTSHAV